MGKKLYVGNLPFSTTEEELRDLFSGQILWAHPDHLWAAAAVSSAVLAAWFLVRHLLGRAGFFVLFAFSVTASVPLVGAD